MITCSICDLDSNFLVTNQFVMVVQAGENGGWILVAVNQNNMNLDDSLFKSDFIGTL